MFWLVGICESIDTHSLSLSLSLYPAFNFMASSSHPSVLFLSAGRFRSHPSNNKIPFQLEVDHWFLYPFAVPSRFPPALRASRRYPNIDNYSHKEAVVVVPDARAWVGDLGADDDGSGIDEDDNEDDEEDDRSLDLLVRFLQNMFQKISRQARKAIRSVLPSSISTKLVRFAVNGVLILAFLWILKAFLEVICTVGSMVFVSILVVRGILSGVSYMKENQFNYINRIGKFSNNTNAWDGVQPVS